MSQTLNNLAAYLWTLRLTAGRLQTKSNSRMILPLTLLRRLAGGVEEGKDAVLARVEKIQTMNLPEEAQEKPLLRATNGLSFYNISKMDLFKLGEVGIAANLETYIQGFFKDAREIFEHFKCTSKKSPHRQRFCYGLEQSL